MKTLLNAAALVGALLVLPSCAQGGVIIPDDWEDLPACERQVIYLEVEAGTDAALGCNLEGSTVETPDGIAFTIPEVGAVGSQGSTEGHEYLVVNWGVPGVGVTKFTGGAPLSWASTPEALQLQTRQAQL